MSDNGREDEERYSRSLPFSALMKVCASVFVCAQLCRTIFPLLHVQPLVQKEIRRLPAISHFHASTYFVLKKKKGKKRKSVFFVNFSFLFCLVTAQVWPDNAQRWESLSPWWQGDLPCWLWSERQWPVLHARRRSRRLSHELGVGRWPRAKSSRLLRKRLSSCAPFMLASSSSVVDPPAGTDSLLRFKKGATRASSASPWQPLLRPEGSHTTWGSPRKWCKCI